MGALGQVSRHCRGGMLWDMRVDITVLQRPLTHGAVSLSCCEDENLLLDFAADHR